MRKRDGAWVTGRPLLAGTVFWHEGIPGGPLGGLWDKKLIAPGKVRHRKPRDPNQAEML